MLGCIIYPNRLQLFIFLHQLFLQLNDFCHRLILCVLQLLCQLENHKQEPTRNKTPATERRVTKTQISHAETEHLNLKRVQPGLRKY